MLIQFTLKNDRLFQNEVLLDFLPAPINEHKASLLRDPADQERVLPLIGIYGPNGCGKSTVLEALAYLASFITGKPLAEACKKPACCRLSEESDGSPTVFDLLFRQDVYLFRYQLELLEEKVEAETLFYGRLDSDDAGILFNRKKQDMQPGRSLTISSFTEPSPSQSLLTALQEDTDSPCIQAAYSWFDAIAFLPSVLPSECPALPREPEQREDICRLLQEMGIPVADYEFSGTSTAPEFTFLHEAYTPGHEAYWLSYEDESVGVRKLLHLLPALVRSLEKGALLIADDLDSILHPALLEAVTRLYTNRENNPHNSQLLFTSHNTAILTPSVLRRDEIWLCCRPSGREAILYPLSSYKKENGLIPRNDEAYGKQYLEGRYGALPKVSHSRG